MIVWSRRFLTTGLLLLWALIVITPLVAIYLSRHGQVTLGPARLFLVQSRDTNGVGLQTTSAVRDQPACQKVSVRFFFWEGGEANANTVNCACSDGIDRAWIGRTCLEP